MRSSHGGGSDPWEFLELSRERWIGTPATSLARSWAEAFVCSQRGPQNVRSVDSVVVRLLRCFASQGFRWYKSTQLGPKPEQLQRVCQWRSWKFCVEEMCLYTTVKSEDTCSAARGMGSPHWGPKFKELIQQQPLAKKCRCSVFLSEEWGAYSHQYPLLDSGSHCLSPLDTLIRLWA